MEAMLEHETWKLSVSRYSHMHFYSRALWGFCSKLSAQWSSFYKFTKKLPGIFFLYFVVRKNPETLPPPATHKKAASLRFLLGLPLVVGTSKVVCF